MVYDDEADCSYTALITVHSASNIPIADMTSLSADPYIRMRVEAPSRSRPPDEPSLEWRTPTARNTRDPVWNDTWLVSGLPRDGFYLELTVIDEDVKDRDDRLGKAHIHFTHEMMFVGFDFHEREFKVQKRKGSIAPYVMTYLASILPGQKLRKHPRIIVSARIVDKSTACGDYRIYTVGPNAYTQHFSPLIGSMINRGNKFAKSLPQQETGNEKKPVKASSFVATQLQLTGPVPKELKFHYVGYNKFIKWLYSKRGISGRLLYNGLRKQYRTIYSYNKSTLYGVVKEEDTMERRPVDDKGDRGSEGGGATGPARSTALARQFLRLTGYGSGGRLQTYVITLDGQWRFSETGDEFAIDFLSKHMMHADGAQIIAYAGEFFVRRIHGDGDQGPGQAQRSEDAEGNMTQEDEDDDPKHYELVIDNDSGTYRPAQETLPILQAWLSDEKNLGGLGRVTAMHCFDDNLKTLKNQRKELKKRLAGGELPRRHQARRSGSSASSLEIDGRKMSSSEVERVVAGAQNINEEKAKAEANSMCEESPGQIGRESRRQCSDSNEGMLPQIEQDVALPTSSSDTTGVAADEKLIRPHDSGINV